jgi:hypothetical protein
VAVEGRAEGGQGGCVLQSLVEPVFAWGGKGGGCQAFMWSEHRREGVPHLQSSWDRLAGVELTIPEGREWGMGGCRVRPSGHNTHNTRGEGGETPHLQSSRGRPA